VNRLLLLLTLLFAAALVSVCAFAQVPARQSCSESSPYPAEGDGCAPGVNGIGIGGFHATPLVDGSATTHWGDPDNNIVSLYGAYGNDESLSSNPQQVKNHYQKGVDLTDEIKPRCRDGSIPSQDICTEGGELYLPRVVFLFIGFSNCDIEICGGHADAWDGQHQGHFQGQPCSTKCPNLNNPDTDHHPYAWNQVDGDPVIQRSFLYQVYPDNDPDHWLVDRHVVVFNGALGGRVLDKWDPTEIGWWWDPTHDCEDDPYTNEDPECEYYRVKTDLHTNGFSEAQVQAVFIKNSDSFPQCDLKGLYCAPGNGPDAYLSEQHLGNILRYLKCCKLDAQHHSTGVPRYPNLKQVFITSRIYGGYANGQMINGHASGHNCLMPEPFAYEEGFAVQRLIVAQVNQAGNIASTDPYSGTVDYDHAPWFDWGPYLWADGETRNSAGIQWCNGQNDGICGLERDVRYGDPNDQEHFWGDFTHPTAHAAGVVADQLVKFIQGDLTTAQHHISDWVVPWISKEP
jgi:hypothetical protein